MKKLFTSLLFNLFFLTFSNNSYAAILSFDLGNASTSVVCTTGSCWSVDQDPLTSLYVNISSYQGLVVNGLTVQAAAGSHSGLLDGSESPGIDNPWEYFGNTGMYFTSSPVSKLGGSGNTISLDLSGLNITWNGNLVPNLGTEAGVNNPAVVVCDFNCGDGESYTLSYTMIIPGECHPVYADPSCFGAVYRDNNIILRGTISGNDLSTVPVPAAVWLFGSGLIGLIGVAKRKKA